MPRIHEIFRLPLPALLAAAMLTGCAGPVGDEHISCFEFGYDWRHSNAENAAACRHAKSSSTSSPTQ